MSEKMWYTLLLEDSCTMEEGEQGQVYIECRVERANQNVDWEHSWRLARLSGLGPENVSFLFKLLHQLLPTQERVARTKPGTSPNCRVQGCQNQIDNIEHALILSPMMVLAYSFSELLGGCFQMLKLQLCQDLNYKLIQTKSSP